MARLVHGLRLDPARAFALVAAFALAFLAAPMHLERTLAVAHASAAICSPSGANGDGPATPAEHDGALCAIGCQAGNPGLGTGPLPTAPARALRPLVAESPEPTTSFVEIAATGPGIGPRGPPA